MVEEKKVKVVQEQSSAGAWIILIVLLLLLIILNFIFSFAPWGYILGFIIFVAIVSTGIYIAVKYFKTDDRKQGIYNEGRPPIPVPIAKNYVLHYLESEGLIGDFSNSEVSEITSLKAGEEGGTFDTNVIFCMFKDANKDSYMVFMEGVMNNKFQKLEKYKKKLKPFNRKEERYVNLLNQLDIKIVKNASNLPKKTYDYVNSYAQKSTQPSLITLDNEGKIIKQEFLFGKRKPEKEEEEEKI